MAPDLPIEPERPSLQPMATPADRAADLLLLLRLVLSDGRLDAAATDALRRVSTHSLGLDAPSFEALLPAIAAYGADETARAGTVFRARPEEERLSLARALVAAAAGDAALKARKRRLRARTAVILDIGESAIR